jgi:dUTP pyrophosphatase
MILEYSKKAENVKTPTRGNPSDAGLDVYAHTIEKKIIAPGSNLKVPTGLRFGIPHGYMLQVCNRSSMASKKSLVLGAHIIDSGYEGEVFIDLHNIGKYEQNISPGDKIAQLVLVPVVPFRILENHANELYEREPITISSRGEGALGSTGK